MGLVRCHRPFGAPVPGAGCAGLAPSSGAGPGASSCDGRCSVAVYCIKGRNVILGALLLGEGAAVVTALPAGRGPARRCVSLGRLLSW